MLEKNGMLTDESHCDFAPSQKAVYVDQLSHKVASEQHKDKLDRPVRIAELTAEQQPS